jgi:hypothetical protein
MRAARATLRGTVSLIVFSAMGLTTSVICWSQAGLNSSGKKGLSAPQNHSGNGLPRDPHLKGLRDWPDILNTPA